MVSTNLPDMVVRSPTQRIPERIRAQVRTLYLVEGNTPKTIEALGVGLTAAQIARLAHTEGWTVRRKEATRLARENVQARHEEAVKSLTEAIAIESEELCFKALNQTRAGLDAGGLEGAKQAQAASSTLKNLAGVAQSIRLQKAGVSADQGSISMNFFFAPQSTQGSNSMPSPLDNAKNVTPTQ